VSSKEVAMPERERIDTGTDKRYVRRDEAGRFTQDQVDVGRASSSDRRQNAKHDTKKGYGDRGDRRD
jgi:hypothetical protein